MKKLILCILLFSLHSMVVFSQTTWSSQIASIVYSNCSTCHRDGGIAPFPLMSYNDALTYGFSIQADVNARKMPPWPADPNYRHFQNEKVLSADDISAINEWVDGGMPSGDLDLAPPPPVFNGASLMKEIDDTVHYPTYTVALNTDEYRSFVVHSNFTQDEYITQIEYIPGNYSVDHHVFFYYDTTNYAYRKDSLDPGPGFESSGMGDMGPYAILWGGWIPGTDLITMPPHMGIRIPKGSDFCIAVHYAPGHQGITDAPTMHLKFSTEANPRNVYNERPLYWFGTSLLNPPFVIPANQLATFYEQSDVATTDKSILAMQPHMHLIGKSFEVILVVPPADTTNLIYIPNWNFNWQYNYFLPRLIKWPVGAQLFDTGDYDNTENNPNNPNNPPLTIHAGETTEDEMMSCRFSLLDYLPGDEDLILDSTVFTFVNNQVVPNDLPVSVFPNPAGDLLHFVTSLSEHEIYWSITNTIGAIVKSNAEKDIHKGMFAQEVNVADLSPGLYFLTITSGKSKAIRKVVIGN